MVSISCPLWAQMCLSNYCYEFKHVSHVPPRLTPQLHSCLAVSLASSPVSPFTTRPPLSTHLLTFALHPSLTFLSHSSLPHLPLPLTLTLTILTYPHPSLSPSPPHSHPYPPLLSPLTSSSLTLTLSHPHPPLLSHPGVAGALGTADVGESLLFFLRKFFILSPTLFKMEEYVICVSIT